MMNIEGKSNRTDVHLDLEYSCPEGRSLRLDLYMPVEAEGPVPVIVWIHGGDWRGYDWVRGSKRPCPVSMYTKKGYAVASVEYRLAPESYFPGPLLDCKSAVRWLRANAAHYGLDVDRIAAWGFGGGALFANLLGCTNHLGEFEKGDNLEQSSRVQAVLDCNGKHYLYWGENQNRSAYWVTAYFNSFRGAQLALVGIGDDEAPLLGGPPNSNPSLALQASPATYVSASNAPILLVTGTESRISAFVQRSSYVKELRAAKGDVTILYVNDFGYGGSALYQDPVVDAFLAKHLKGVSLPESAASHRIYTSSRIAPRRSFDRFFDEENPVMISSSSLCPWDNAVKGFFHPLMERRRFLSKEAMSEVDYLVYLPPSYKREPERRYPVLYLMSTGAQTIDDCSLYLVELVHASASSGDCPEMIIVVPNNSFIAARKPFGLLVGNQSERMLNRDFIPHVDATYRTIATSEGRALQGGCGGSMENLAYAIRPAKPLFSLVSIAAPMYHWTVLPLLRSRRKSIGDKVLLELCYDENDTHGTGALSIKLVNALEKLGVRAEHFIPHRSGVHIWSEFLTQTNGNGFARWKKRLGHLDPRLQAEELPQGVEVQRDHVYEKCGDKSLLLDLYLPSHRATPLPLVLWLHGTDWRGNLFNDGNKDQCSLSFLADRGYIVASVEYSLADEEPFPGQVQNCQAAIQWLLDRSTEFGIDGSSIALCGESAGGALASLTGLFTTANPGRVPRHSLRQNLGIKAVVCCGAPFELGSLDAMRWRDSLNGGAFQGDRSSGVSKILGGKAASYASPISYAYGDAPPHLLIHGSEDTVVSPRQSGLMHRELLGKGASSHLAIVNGGGHGFVTLSDESSELIGAFLDARLRGQPDDFSRLEDGLRPTVNSLGSARFECFKDPVTRENPDAAYHAIASPALGEEMSFLLSKPPLYDKMPDASYPVVFLFPDQDESPRDYFNYVAMRREAIYAEAAPEALLVIVNGSARGSYQGPGRFALLERAILEDLLPYVETHWRVRAAASSRLLEGFGQGANAAARMAFRHPDVFGAVSMIGPALEPDCMSAPGIADLFDRSPSAAQNVSIRLVDTSHVADSSARTNQLKERFEATGALCHCERSDLPIDDRLIAFIEADFDVFAFHRESFSGGEKTKLPPVAVLAQSALG